MNEILRMKPPESIDFKRHMDRLRQIQELRAETSLWRDETKIHVDTQGMPYFYLMPLADLHIGAQGCDMESVAEHLDFLKKHNVATVLVGDLGDFFSPTKHPDGMLRDVITPDDQMLLLRRFMQEYRDNILGVVQDSSHPDWVRQASGVEPYRWMAEDLGIPLLNNGGLIDLTVNNQRYSIGCYHEISRYNSSFNRTHALKRMRELDRPTDVVLGAHRHIGAMEKAVHQDDKPMFVQLGTFKTKDGYGTRRGMVPSPQTFFPTLFFDGRKHNVEAVENLEAAGEMIEALESHQKQLAVAHLGLSS
jgi:hypothetical protein